MAPIEGQSVTPLDLAPRELRISIASAETPEPSRETSAEWAELVAQNPRYFDAPILVSRSYDDASLTLHAAIDRYRHLACASHPEALSILSVTGILLATDGLGSAHVLLARRSDQTRVYGNMWELGPSGGLDPPPTRERLSTGAIFDGRDAWRQLVLEIEEEVSLPISPDPGRIVGLVTDAIARSTDIVFRVPIARSLEDLMNAQGETNWEYTESRWVAVSDIAGFDSAFADEILPPTRAIFRMVGWYA